MKRAGEGSALVIMVGELALLVCSACYLVWWTLTFRPTAPGGGGGPFLGGAVLGGLAGLVLLAVGIAALIPRASLPGLVGVIIGGVLVGVLLLVLTTTIAHRPVTTELPLIIVWGTAQLATAVTLRTAGALSGSAATLWVVLLALATVVGLVCYLIFYRLDPAPAYWVGMVPLAVDGVVAAALAVLAWQSHAR